MALTKITSNAFAASAVDSDAVGANTITTAKIADNNVTHAKLHTDMDLSSKTVTLPTISSLTVSGGNTHLDGRNSAGLTLDLAGTGHYTIREHTTDDIVKLGGTGSVNFIAHNISSGYVGIGTSSPSTKLHLYGTSGNQYVRAEATANSSRSALITLGKQSDGTVVQGFFGSVGDANQVEVATLSNHAIKFYTNNNPTNDNLIYGSNPRLWLTTPSGYNGLRVYGDTTPFEFQINSGSYNGAKFTMGSTGDLSLIGVTTSGSDTYNDSPNFFLNATRWNGSANVTSFQGTIRAHARSATNADGYLGIGANANADHIAIDASTGNVGIGTTSPTFGASGFGLEVKGTGRPTVRVTEETNTHAVQLSAIDGAAILESRSSGMDLVFGTSGVEKMRIDDTNGYAQINSASQIRLSLGNVGTPGTNTANWIRGTGNSLGLNAASDNIHFEIGGNEKSKIQSGRISFNASGSVQTNFDSWLTGTDNQFDITIAAQPDYNSGVAYGGLKFLDAGWSSPVGTISMGVNSGDSTEKGYADQMRFTVKKSGGADINANVLALTPSQVNVNSDNGLYIKDGFPYYNALRGTVTTDSNGYAEVNLANWSWGTFMSYRRNALMMISFVNDTNRDQHIAFGLASAVYFINIEQHHMQSSSSISATIDLNTNGSTGGRKIRIQGARASSTFTYTIKALPTADEHWTWYGI